MQGNRKLYTKSSVTHASTHSVSLWACLYLSNTWTLMPCWTLWWGVLQTAAHRQASYWAILQGIDPEYHSNTPRHTHTHLQTDRYLLAVQHWCDLSEPWWKSVSCFLMSTHTNEIQVHSFSLNILSQDYYMCVSVKKRVRYKPLNH